MTLNAERVVGSGHLCSELQSIHGLHNINPGSSLKRPVKCVLKFDAVFTPNIHVIQSDQITISYLLSRKLLDIDLGSCWMWLDMVRAGLRCFPGSPS